MYYMELNKLETQILIDIYDSDMTVGKSIKIQDYELTEKDTKEKTHEVTFYLEKLKRLGFLSYDESRAFISGGWKNTKYKNNVIMIWGEQLHISPKGMELVEEAKKTTTQKFKEKGIDVAKGIGGIAKDEFNELFSKSIGECFKKITGQ